MSVTLVNIPLFLFLCHLFINRKLTYEKTNLFAFLLPLAVAVTACGGKKGSSDNQSLLARIDSIDAHGLQRMQTSKSETNFKFKGKDYHSFVSRTRTKVCLM